MVQVSVIVPVYNVEKYLAKCLDSLLNQTIDEYEIICVNDSSPDNSASILDQYGNKYPDRIRLVNNPENKGLGLSRNEGLKIAKGSYILFVDSDDYVKPDYIETYLREMKKDPVDVLVGGYIREIENKQKEHFPSASVWSMVTYALACAKMYNKQFLINNNLQFNDLSCGEDIYFNLAVYYRDASYRIIDYAGYYYVFNKFSITGSMNYRRNHEQIMASLFECFCREYDLTESEQKRQVIEYVYLANMINALTTFSHGCGISRMREKYSYVKNDCMRRFPDCEKNPFIGLFKPKGQTLKIRFGVGGVFLLKRIHLDKIFFYAVSLL